jgi:hypothetical protein
MKKLIPLFLLVLLFITGCDLSGLTVTTTNQSPVINSFSASPSNISAGESSTLNWTVTRRHHGQHRPGDRRCGTDGAEGCSSERYHCLHPDGFQFSRKHYGYDPGYSFRSDAFAHAWQLTRYQLFHRKPVQYKSRRFDQFELECVKCNIDNY